MRLYDVGFLKALFFFSFFHLYSLSWHTAISRKVAGKNVHATIPKGNMGYDQYTVPETSCRNSFEEQST